MMYEYTLTGPAAATASAWAGHAGPAGLGSEGPRRTTAESASGTAGDGAKTRAVSPSGTATGSVPRAPAGRRARSRGRGGATPASASVAGAECTERGPDWVIVAAPQPARARPITTNPATTPRLTTVHTIGSTASGGDAATVATSVVDVAAGQVYVAVSGGGNADDAAYAAAEELGRELARRGAVVVTGGLGGAMEAACRGAKAAGGTTVGILPTGDRADAN